MMDSPVSGHSLRRHQVGVLTLLFLGYAAYYFCRANLSVATPLIVRELVSQGIAPDRAIVLVGSLSSLGVLAYALGKLCLSGVADRWGGRRSFLVGLAGAAAFTLLFAAGGGVPVFTLAAIGNRLTQSVGWAGLLKVCSRWFDFSSHGAIIGMLSVSYLVGDALARQGMGLLMAHGVGWRGLYVFAAAVAVVLMVANAAWLSDARVHKGFSEPASNPLGLFEDQPAGPWLGLGARLRLMLSSPSFLLLCALSFGGTLIRETFNTWTPQYLSSALHLTADRAAAVSAVFPGVGVLSVLLAGWYSDRLGVLGRPWLLCLGLMATSFALLLLVALSSGAVPVVLPIAAVGLVAFCLLGPYSYLGGAFALDVGGQRAGALASGLIDGIGYLGGALAGSGVAELLLVAGWHGVFLWLAVASAVASMAAGMLLWNERRRIRRRG